MEWEIAYRRFCSVPPYIGRGRIVCRSGNEHLAWRRLRKLSAEIYIV